MLTKERKGEIAYIFVKRAMKREGLRLDRDEFRRNAGNAAKATGIPEKELMEFSEMIVREIVDETFRR